MATTDPADAIVVLVTPYEALTRQWKELDTARYVQVIAGQEMGKNAERLVYAAREDEYEKRPIAEFDAFLPKNPLWLQ